LTDGSVGISISSKLHPHVSEPTKFEILGFPGTYWGTEELLTLDRQGNSKIRVLVCSLVSPVVVTDFIIKLLLDFRVLLKVLICCHCADLFLHHRQDVEANGHLILKLEKHELHDNAERSSPPSFP
jgi:hypothetical protein